jgi:hypothetical protein
VYGLRLQRLPTLPLSKQLEEYISARALAVCLWLQD